MADQGATGAVRRRQVRIDDDGIGKGKGADGDGPPTDEPTMNRTASATEAVREGGVGAASSLTWGGRDGDFCYCSCAGSGVLLCKVAQCFIVCFRFDLVQ